MSTTPPILAVVFDLDHTLFDRYGTLRKTAQDIFLERREWLSADISEKEAADVMIEADGKYITSGWKPVYAYWLEKGILALDSDGKPVANHEELFDFIWNYSFLRHAEKFPFAIPTLERLRKLGLKVGLLTNAANEEGIRRQRAKLEMLGLSDKFDEILISGEVGIQKPDRRIFDIMTDRIGIPAENMLYVGDHPINDVAGSKSAGYTPVWVSLRAEHGETAECEYRVKDVSEVVELVERRFQLTVDN